MTRMNRSLAPYARLICDGTDLLFDSSYDAGLVATLKAHIPAKDRVWDGARKVWRIAPQHGQTLAQICQTYLGVTVPVPDIAPTDPARPETRAIYLEYLGACKQREGGSISAMGYADGAWSIVAPEPVLRRWFEGSAIGASEPTRQTLRPETYYGLLGIAQTASDADIKAGYRRMARQWHPDVCSEPNAHDMFLLVQGAYNILSDPLLRRKYDAGLVFANSGSHGRFELRVTSESAYRTPLRCGMVVADATRQLGRWHLVTIHAWADITDLAGRVMVASWDKNRERIRTEWVMP